METEAAIVILRDLAARLDMANGPDREPGSVVRALVTVCDAVEAMREENNILSGHVDVLDRAMLAVEKAAAHRAAELRVIAAVRQHRNALDFLRNPVGLDTWREVLDALDALDALATSPSPLAPAAPPDAALDTVTTEETQ